MSETNQIPPQPQPSRRSRKIVEKVIEQAKIEQQQQQPKKKLDIDFIEDGRINPHDVVQFIAGQNRGRLAQIADFDNGIYRCYVINPGSAPEVIEAAASEIHHVGKAKVASKTPLAALSMNRPVPQNNDEFDQS